MVNSKSVVVVVWVIEVVSVFPEMTLGGGPEVQATRNRLEQALSCVVPEVGLISPNAVHAPATHADTVAPPKQASKAVARTESIGGVAV